MGEFGPILATVVGDAIRGTVTWGHWETGPAGLLAVFHFVVPREVSRYRVESQESGDYETPAYFGELAVDPASGAIYRITLTAEGSKSSASRESNLSLEYGPVEIGGATYVCPLHGVAYTKPRQLDERGEPVPVETAKGNSSFFLNDVTFSNYHLFRSETRILTGEPAK
jgi:hypothetical protein